MGIVNIGYTKQNTAPPMPATLTIPATVNSGTSYTISWSAVVDPDADTVTYVLEYLYNGGSWTQLYSGTGTSATQSITVGKTSIQWRVKAVDSQGHASAYNTSASKTINNAPSAPSSISTSVSTVTGGKSLTVSWGASTDVDGGTITYYLECLYNGGSWTQIYSGTTRSYTHTVTAGKTSVQYRVRAKDNTGLYSGYTTSSTVTVLTYQLIGDLALGSKVYLGSWQWTVVAKNQSGYPSNSVTLFSGELGTAAMGIRYKTSAAYTLAENSYSGMTATYKNKILETSIKSRYYYYSGGNYRQSNESLTVHFFVPSHSEMTGDTTAFANEGAGITYLTTAANRKSTNDYWLRTVDFLTNRFRYQAVTGSDGKINLNAGTASKQVRVLCNVSSSQHVSLTTTSGYYTFV